MRRLTLFLVLAACGDDGIDGQADAGSDGDGMQDAAFVCDPLLQIGCTGGQACYSDLYLSPTGDPDYYCASPGTGTQDASCTADTDCAAGFWCLKYRDPNDVLVQICSRYCHQGCTGGDTCIESNDNPFGYCI